MSVWLSSGAFSSREFPHVQIEAEDWGIKNIELSSGLIGGNNWHAKIDEGVSLGHNYLVHNYVPAPDQPITLNIASSDDAQLSQTLAFVMQAIDLAAHVKAPFYSLHAGFCLDLLPEVLGQPELQAAHIANAHFDRASALERMEQVVCELADYAAQRNVKILLENNVLHADCMVRGESPYLLTEPTEISSFLGPLTKHGVGLLLDVAHAQVSAHALGFSPDRFFAKCGHLVGALHLSETKAGRDVNAPITPNAWFLPFLTEYTSAPFVCEVYNIDRDTAVQQLLFLKKIKIDQNSNRALVV